MFMKQFVCCIFEQQYSNDRASGNEESHGSMQVRGIEVETVVEQEDVIEQASGSESYEHRVCEYIKTLTEKLIPSSLKLLIKH